MWCRECNEEFEGQSHCPDCGTVLEALPKTQWVHRRLKDESLRWPQKYDGEPDRPVFLTHTSAVNMEDKLFEGLLDSSGIPYITYYPNDGEMGKIIVGLPGSGVDFYVPESYFEKAKELLADITYLKEGSEDNDLQ